MTTETMTTEQERADALYRARRVRFNMILDGYETPEFGGSPLHSCAGFTSETLRGINPDAERVKPGRWAVVTESTRGHGYFVTNVEQRGDVESVAAENVHEGWQPVCFYDLDLLAGGEPRPTDGDVVLYQDTRYHVLGSETDTFDGEAYEKLYLGADPEGNYLAGEYEHLVDEANVIVIERDAPDERMPVRYLLARIVTVVAFNSTPEQP